VLLDERAVRDSLGHGMNETKAEAFAAVQAVIEKGRIVQRGEKDGVPSIYVAAPVRIGEVDDVVIAQINSSPQRQGMYLHSVMTKESLLAKAVNPRDATNDNLTGRAQLEGAYSIVQNALNFKGEVSKVTDPETGEPMVMYHGTHSDFTKFLKKYGGRSGSDDGKLGFFFTDNREVATDYAGRSLKDGTPLPSGRVMEVFLSAKSVSEYNLDKTGAIGTMALTTHIRYAKEDGDGVLFRNLKDPGGFAWGTYTPSTIAVVFSGNQVKSATGNNGAFSEENDIMFSVEEEEPTGHAQPLTAKVLTPSGFKLMGDIHVGDEVITIDGSATKVTDVFPQGKKPIYRIVLSDGSETRCTADHLWAIKGVGVISTYWLMKGTEQGLRFQVPKVTDNCFEQEKTP
jgi:hypothetical protein